MLALTNPVQPYAWGEVDGLVRWTGVAASGGPQAELWIGAHPAAPSRLDDGRTLGDAVAADPGDLLGPDVVARFGPRLPFLLKVLAIGAPLSIQLHPSVAQAEAGFAREEAAGVPRDAPERTYRDAAAKPEVLVALAPTWVLAGFRSGPDAAAALAGLGPDAPAGLAERVATAADARDGLVHLLTADPGERAVLVAAAAAAARRPDSAGPAMAWVRRLARDHPGDPTALAPLLLRVRRLAPGDALFLPAGVPHAYLRGAGVELMGASDNVVRGGLTTKHVDRDELPRLLAPPGTDVVTLGGAPAGDGVRVYAPDVPEIRLARVRPGPARVGLSGPPGPALVVATEGSATVHGPAGDLSLAGGRAAFVAAAERDGTAVSGPGTVWWATVGGSSPGG